MSDREVFTIYRCPECGEQIENTEYDPERGIVRGHYHDPPEAWLDENDLNPHGTGEDPWFDAVAIQVISIDAVVEALREAGIDADVQYPGDSGDRA